MKARNRNYIQTTTEKAEKVFGYILEWSFQYIKMIITSLTGNEITHRRDNEIETSKKLKDYFSEKSFSIIS